MVFTKKSTGTSTGMGTKKSSQSSASMTKKASGGSHSQHSVGSTPSTSSAPLDQARRNLTNLK